MLLWIRTHTIIMRLFSWLNLQSLKVVIMRGVTRGSPGGTGGRGRG